MVKRLYPPHIDERFLCLIKKEYEKELYAEKKTVDRKITVMHLVPSTILGSQRVVSRVVLG